MRAGAEPAGNPPGGAARVRAVHHGEQGVLLGHQDDRPGRPDDSDGSRRDRHRRGPGEHVELPLLAARHALGQPDGPPQRADGRSDGLRRPLGRLLQPPHGHSRVGDGGRVRLHPAGPGRVGLHVPDAGRGGHEGGPPGRRDLPRGDQKGQGHVGLRQGRGTPDGHDPGRPGQAAPRLQPQEHRHGPDWERDRRQRPGGQRRGRCLHAHERREGEGTRPETDLYDPWLRGGFPADEGHRHGAGALHQEGPRGERSDPGQRGPGRDQRGLRRRRPRQRPHHPGHDERGDDEEGERQRERHRLRPPHRGHRGPDPHDPGLRTPAPRGATNSGAAGVASASAASAPATPRAMPC